ncbi:hypothetical protein A3F06_01450 [candidate division TM6 bacterium RIFCSPHIGHO2_12_FULL_36_22]|nr:MAG: hypothetical protein A3F06_01450 [candidate division TM6 bacterium RIFCSPHIGHO2_12_FULL_36_22]
MLCPQGDSKVAGRTTPDGAERGVTRLWAEQIKKALEENNPNIRVVFSHNLGEHIGQKEKANFANRLQINLFISLLCYTTDNLSISLYCYGNKNSCMMVQPKKLSFCPYNLAYTFSASITPQYTNLIYNNFLHNPQLKNIAIQQPIYAPLNCLMGIKAPAIAIEAGLKQSQDWRYYVRAVTEALHSLMEQLL